MLSTPLDNFGVVPTRRCVGQGHILSLGTTNAQARGGDFKAGSRAGIVACQHLKLGRKSTGICRDHLLENRRVPHGLQGLYEVQVKRFEHQHVTGCQALSAYALAHEPASVAGVQVLVGHAVLVSDDAGVAS